MQTKATDLMASQDNKAIFDHALTCITETILTNEDTQVILESMVRIFGEALRLDRAFIYEFDFDQQLVLGLCEWNNSATPGIFSTLNNWQYDQFRNLADYLIANHTWLVSHADEIHPLLIKDGVAELLHKQLGVRSLLYFPFSIRHDDGYLLVFSSISRRRDWSEQEIEFIQAVAKHVEIGIQKIRLLKVHQEAERIIWEEKERALVTLQSIGDAVITTNAQGFVQYLNPIAEALTGCSNSTALGQPLGQVYQLTTEKTPAMTTNIRQSLLISKAGCKYPIEETISPIKNREGETIGSVLVFRDVSERRRILQQMTYQAYHDPLTGLPNRILFNDRLAQALTAAQRNQDEAAVLFLDLDRFKLVNDMMGHAVGDNVLKEVANKLQKCIRKNDTIARLGGDEFTIILPKVDSVQGVGKVTEKIIKALQKPWILGEQEFYLTASIGVAVFPHDGEDAETILKHADISMYRAKERGGNSYQFYTPDMNEKIWERLTMENSLRHALKRKEFVVFYQPQVDVTKQEIIGAEALVRWNHPELALIPPAEFIPLAEDTGFIVPLGEWVLTTACLQNKAWQTAGCPPIQMTVNLSMRQFMQRNLVEMIRGVLTRTGLDPSWLELEITETVAMQDIDFTLNILEELKAMGIKIAIDDFGTGYSSLNYLKRFPIHTLKIDRSFVCDVLSNPQDAAIVDTIIVLAQNLNLRTVAEGVETREQLNFLLERQCKFMQGYLFSKPVSASEFEKLIK